MTPSDPSIMKDLFRKQFQLSERMKFVNIKLEMTIFYIKIHFGEDFPFWEPFIEFLPGYSEMVAESFGFINRCLASVSVDSACSKMSPTCKLHLITI